MFHFFHFQNFELFRKISPYFKNIDAFHYEICIFKSVWTKERMQKECGKNIQPFILNMSLEVYLGGSWYWKVLRIVIITSSNQERSQGNGHDWLVVISRISTRASSLYLFCGHIYSLSIFLRMSILDREIIVFKRSILYQSVLASGAVIRNK